MPYLLLSLAVGALTFGYRLLRPTPLLLEFGLIGMIGGLVFLTGYALLRRSKRRKQPSTAIENKHALIGTTSYIVSIGLLSWASLSGLRDHLPQDDSRFMLLTCAATYCWVMGWQPALARVLAGRFFTPSLSTRTSSRGGLLLALGLPATFVLIAMLTSWGLGVSELPLGDQSWKLLFGAPSTDPVLRFSLMTAVVALITVQAVVEEFGWRGYFLPTLAALWGRSAALVIHGVFWGLWYLPLIYLSPGALGAGVSGSTFVLTKAVLGIFLGWLYFWRGNIWLSSLANITITLLSLLPLLFWSGETASHWAPFGPAGWLPLIALAVLTLRLHRREKHVLDEDEEPVLVVLELQTPADVATETKVLH